MDKLREQQSWLTTGALVVLAVIALDSACRTRVEYSYRFVLAIFVASVGSPLVDFQIVRMKFSRVAAIVVALLVVVTILCGFGLLIVNCFPKCLEIGGRVLNGHR